MNTLVKLSIVMAILSSLVFIFVPNISKYDIFNSNYAFTAINTLLEKLNQLVANDHKMDSTKSCLSGGEVLMSRSQLSRYDGSGDSLGLYLSFLGVIYDVSKGSQHYKPGGSYSFFAGKDASKAFITGDFAESGLTDDLSELDIQSFDGIQTWIDLYENDYKRVGKLIGTYYDSNGCETQSLHWVRQQIQLNNHLKEQQNDELKVFPYCNSEWSGVTNSGRVWCSRGSGGQDRDWVGVPRQLFVTEKKQYRCACVRDSGPPTQPAIVYADDDTPNDKTSSDEDIGDLSNPLLKEYDGCNPASFECRIKD